MTELLMVGLVLMVLSAITSLVAKAAREFGQESACTGNLRLTGFAFESYAQDAGAYPSYIPPAGLGNRTQWYDLWSQSDTPFGNHFSALDANGDGIPDGDTPLYPRVPRALVAYTDSVAPLHCPGIGMDSTWPNVGPYYYNTTKYNTGLWEPIAAQWGNRRSVALAGCQSPPPCAALQCSWRHSDRRPGGENGRNHHLFIGQRVKALTNPQTWSSR